MPIAIADVHSLPVCPTSKTLRSLSPSLHATILEHITTALSQALSLSDQQLSKLSCSDFVSSYTTDGAIDILNSLVFPDEKAPRQSNQEREIRKRVLILAQRLATLPKAGGLDLQTLVNLCILYGPKNLSKARNIIELAVKQHRPLLSEFEWTVLPAFAQTLLSTGTGLHGLRKALFCITSLLQCSPADVIGIISGNNEFLLALAKCYDTRLSAISAGYGGIRPDQPDETGTTRLWLECKVAIIDAFHILLQNVLEAVKENPQSSGERAFDLVFSLLNLPSSSAQSFLNRTLIADYQDVYNLSSTLQSILANNDDPRLDVLSSTLQSFESSANKSSVLKLLLRSNGAAPGIDVHGNHSDVHTVPAPAHQPSSSKNDVATEIAITSVMDILPDYEAPYIRSLLSLPQYAGNAEKVIAALLEGTAPAPESLLSKLTIKSAAETSLPPPRVEEPRIERRNVFNDQGLDTSKITIGKRREDAESVLRDRSFLDQMKADILRRAAELSESEEEEVEIDEHGKKVRIAAFEEEDDDELDGGVKVVADGEATSDEEGGEAPPEEDSVETILELAYIDNPKVFDRDSNTRRSKARVELRAKTNWSDEQLEGWRIMLERDPKKDKILQKHEFAGNKIDSEIDQAGPSTAAQQVESNSGESSQRGGRGRGRGGRGRGGRGGGVGGGRGGAGGGDDAKSRAWKDKNKARQANHNRKRGHDRKMARGGANPGPTT